MKLLFTTIFGMYFFYFLEKPKEVETKFSDCIFLTDKMPLFNGCDLDSLNDDEKRECSEEKLLKFFYKNFKYSSRMDCYAGRIYIRWTIEKNGEITNVKFLRRSIIAIENEARRIIQLMPCWTSGEQDGKPIAVCFNFPLHLEYSCR